MKWEKIKEKVACQVYTNVIEARNWQTMSIILVDMVVQQDLKLCSRETIKTYADKAYETIMNWDVRCVGKLRELFPDYFPKSLSKGRLMADLEDSGWAVYALSGDQT